MTRRVIVLPTGAGKSLVIAELARLARKRILVITHVRELVEQNHAKYAALGLEAAFSPPVLADANSITRLLLPVYSRSRAIWRTLRISSRS